jgi:hypothetical protein
VNWGINYYNPDVLTGGQYDKSPTNATPKWVAQYSASNALVDSYLRISTMTNNRLFYYTTNNWNLSEDMTVEATLRVVSSSGTSAAGSLRFGNPNFYGTVLFNTNKIGSVLQDMTDWTTVRLVFQGMSSTNTATMKVYVNNSTNVLYTSKTWTGGTTLNQLGFGDPNTSSTDGTIEWESIRWTSGAFVPGYQSPLFSLIVLSSL